MNVLNLEECELLCDSKYRAYVSQVDKALKAFEYTSEWADLISALGKLNKVLSSHIRYPVIPKKVTIGKRLAQCLHPALPSGVHLRVLETYDIIFKCIGTTRLASDLFTYGSGLFPLMGYAAMNVRPVLLQLYETHFIALQKHIKPALTGLVMGLLPGLEEGSEHFSRTVQLLEEFCEAAEPSFFYGCLWECVLASAANRLAGINFVLSHFNRKQSMEDQLFFMGTNLDILVKGLCVALQDSSILVQRSTLDLLIACFPIYNSQLPKSDMIKLLTAAIKVVLRRDMSLNRRLYAWLIGCDSNGLPLAATAAAAAAASTSAGPASGDGGRLERQDSTNTSEMDYFNTYAKELLIAAVRNSLLESGDAESGHDARVVNLKPFKVLMSLLDKPEIGSAILEDILMEIFRCMYRECVTKVTDSHRNVLSKENVGFPATADDLHVVAGKSDGGGVNSEIVKTANLLFGALEPYFIWHFISRAFKEACKSAPKVRGGTFGKGDASITELCQLVDFLLDKLSVEAYKETQTEHLPRLLQCLMSSMTECIDQMTDSELLLCLRLCSKILSRVQPSVMLVGASDILSKPRHGSTTHDYVKDSDTEASQEVGHLMTKGKPDEIDGDNISGDVAKETPDVVVANGNSVSSASASGRDTGGRVLDSEFCDFVQFENEEERCSMVKDSGETKEKVRETQTNLQNCIENFVQLFEAFLTKRLLVNCNQPKIMQFLSQGPGAKPVDTRNYPLVSDECVSSHARDANESGTVARLPLAQLSLRSCQAFASACQLLVEFSSLPIFCTSNYKTIQKSFQQDFTFPSWLQLLLTCACAIRNFSIESAAISAVLDLICLTQSFIAQLERKGGSSQNYQDGMEDVEDGNQVAGDNTVSVLILPLLTPNDLVYMNEKTNFYQLVARNLWEYLDDETPEYHSRTVELLNQLQQLSPNPWTCEDVISSALLSDDKTMKVSAHRKFAIFWHLLRDRTTATPRILPVRTFDRSLLVMLDSLQSDIHLSSSLTQTWLLHAVQRGDLMRILEPLLLILLHPDTARVSIQHVSIQKSRHLRISTSERSEDSNSGSGGDIIETNIFAISSEGGNIIYHVSNNGRTFSKKTIEDLRTYTLTFVSEKGSATKASKANVEMDLDYTRVDPSDVNLTVNPFGSQHSSDSEVFENGGGTKPSQLQAVQKAVRLTKDEKEKIFFDDNEQEDYLKTSAALQESALTSKGEDVSPEVIVRGILDEIVNDVLAHSSSAVTVERASDTAIEEDRLRDDVNRSRSSSKEKPLVLDFDDDHYLHNGHLSDIESQSDAGVNAIRRNSLSRHEELPNVHPLHTHILLYTQKYDARRTLYALSCLKSVISTNPHLVTVALTTSNIGSTTTPHVTQVLNLLIRHRRSVLGKNFNSELPPDASVGVRSSMFVEVLISVCLFYIRGYYPNLMMSKLSEVELNANKEIQILSSDVLTMIFSELTVIAQSSGRGVATYIGELLLKCKVQKALLYSLMASVYNSRLHVTGQEETIDISEAIINFNDKNMDADANETLQIKLIKLLLAVIMLEDQIQRSKGDAGSKTGLPPEYEQANLNAQLSSIHYLGGVSLVYQPMLLSAIVNMLRQQHMCHMHRHWVMMAISAMPFVGRALTKIVLATVNQVCRNLELLAQLFQLGHVIKSLTYQPDHIPADHVVTLLEGLTTICHYCLLDTNQQDVSVVGVLGQSMSSSAASGAGGSAAAATGASASGGGVHGGLLFNLIHVFQLSSANREASPSKETQAVSNPRMEARGHLLNILPRILASLAVLWKAIHISEKKQQQGIVQPWWSLGTPKMVRHCILELLSPVALHHAQHMMAAVAVVWNERRQQGPTSVKRVIPVAADDQLILVDLISTVKLLPLDTIIHTVKQIIRQPGQTTTDTIRKRVPLEVGLLRFLYAYIQRVDGAVLDDTWPLLLSLFREGLQINLVPPGQFILLSILNEFLQKIVMFEERKDQKDLQEITQKLLEACSEIAGSSLEQVTFFRRNLAVKPGKQMDVNEMDEMTTDVEVEGPESPPVLSTKPHEPVAMTTAGAASQHQYSVQALILLAEVTATLLDVVYRSEEKERVIPLLNNILYNVFPYLKNHRAHNLPSFRACSQLLSSLSSYQYTRKTWKKEAFDLLLDYNFFQMDDKCIRSWMTTVDNLMTHDRGSSFRDLLIRVNATQSSLFGSREAEFEQRAQLLKRLAFTIFCSEVDQYQKHMPDIQEKLADCLRMSNVLSLQAQVFLCFRVLILRISPQYLTSLWPTIITELVHVMLQIEQDLAPDADVLDGNHSSRMMLDPSWTLGNGVVSLSSPAWLQLYVSACKLLDLALCLPADLLPQFQLYRWAFVADPSGLQQDNEKRKIRDQPPSFVPHVIRIARLMKAKFGDVPLLPHAVQRPLLTTPRSCSIQDLCSFFVTIYSMLQDGTIAASTNPDAASPSVVTSPQMQRSASVPNIHSGTQSAATSFSLSSNSSAAPTSTVQLIEQIIIRDFLEPIPNH